jgi:hypothetical protein
LVEQPNRTKECDVDAPVSAALAPLVVWHRIVVADALVLAVEAALLVFGTQYRRRPWFERLLAVAPAGAFLWVAYVARDLHGTYVDWQNYANWITTHYPPAFAQHTFDGLGAVVAGAERLGWLVFIVTLGMTELGWALLLQGRFAAQPAPQSQTVSPSEADDSLELTVGPID